MKSGFKVTAIILLVLLFNFRHLPHDMEAHAEDGAQNRTRLMTADVDAIQLKDFILFVSRFTGRNIVFRDDQIPPSKVSMLTQIPMAEPELLAVFESILSSNNLELVAKGDVFYVLHTPAVQTMTESFSQSAGKGTEHELITTVIQLSSRTPIKSASELLRPFASRFGVLQEIPSAGALLIKDTRQSVLRMMDIVRALDEIDPAWETAMIPLSRADAKKTADKVINLYQGLMERGRMSAAPLVSPVEWSNSILVAGAPDQLKTVRSLIRGLDHVAERNIGLKIYELKNARAENAAQVMGNLLSSSGEGESRLEGMPRIVIAPDVETNSILILADPQMVPQTDEIIEHLDRPLAQVFVEALIVETTLEHSQDFGVEWLAGGGGADGLATTGFVAPDSLLGPLMSMAAPPIAPGGLSIGVLGNIVTYADKKFSTLGALVNFLKSATDFNILSTPQIMTLNNSKAEIFIGENRPFLVGERTDPQNNVIRSYDYRDVGIRLLVTPIINTKTSMIRLEVEQEVKNVLPQSDKLAPITMNRNTRTNVQLPSGSTMVISGLIENAFAHNRSAVPGLSRIPGLGWAFRRETVSAPKTTLMVFLSARIIEVLDDADDLTADRMRRIEETRKSQEEILEREFWKSPHKREQSFELQVPGITPPPPFEPDDGAPAR